MFKCKYLIAKALQLTHSVYSSEAFQRTYTTIQPPLEPGFLILISLNFEVFSTVILWAHGFLNK